jgi:hypothetical protein
MIFRTSILRNLVHNSNPAWRTALQDRDMKVAYTFRGDDSPVTLQIVYHKQVPEAAFPGNHNQSAWQLLDTWGLFNLPGQDEIDFIFESKRVSNRLVPGGRCVVGSEKYQVSMYVWPE